MSEALIYKLSGRPTGRQVARGLGLAFGTPFYYRKNPPRRIAVRWGGADWEQYEDGRTINKAEAIRRASSKLHSFRTLRDAGVPIPRFTTSSNEAREWATMFLGRTSQGFQGRGIQVYRGGSSPARHELYAEFIPNEREYRVHICRGVVVSLQRKYLERADLKGDGFIKNVSHGYVFKTPEKDLNKSRKEAAIAAVEALGLDFGAVDMVIDSEGKEFILEVNTAPALSPLRVQQYVEALRPLVRA